MRKVFLTLLVAIGLVLNLAAQDRVITGKVSDANGIPVANASVTVVGGKVGTATDANGDFKITVPPTAKELLISAVNFDSKRFAITGDAISAVLAFKANSMQEVVITGISRVRRGEFTGATT